MVVRADLETWKQAAKPACTSLLEAVAAGDTRAPSTLARLRRSWSDALIHVAIELARAREKASAKFPNAATLVADVEGVEQATSAVVAQHKAARFAKLGGDANVLDLCCGIGGDAMALAQVGTVSGVDQDCVRAWMTAENAGCRTEAADVETIDLAAAVVHLDPSRRQADAGTTRRTRRYEDYRPGPAFIERTLASCPAGAVKLGPGLDLAALPRLEEREVELISEHGTLVQTVLWAGRLAREPGARTATRLPEGEQYTGVPAEASDPACGNPGAFLYVPDPALERTRLLGRFGDECGAAPIVDGLGLLTADDHIATPWLTAFEVIAQMPWRERRIRAWLAEHGAGIVEVKTRGGAVEPDGVQRALRGDGDERFTVFGLRLGRRVVAVITRRV